MPIPCSPPMPMLSPPTGSATAFDATRFGKRIRPLLLAALAIALPQASRAAEPSARPIIQCELNGKKVTSDRLIPECHNKEQRELYPDGSLKRIIPPTPTADELAAKEEKDREAKLEFAARSDAVRRDRNLMQRFPDEAADRGQDLRGSDRRVADRKKEARGRKAVLRERARQQAAPDPAQAEDRRER